MGFSQEDVRDLSRPRPSDSVPMVLGSQMSQASAGAHMEVDAGDDEPLPLPKRKADDPVGGGAAPKRPRVR